MPKLYFGARGGMYYRKGGRRVYVKGSSFGMNETPDRRHPPPGAPGAPRKPRIGENIFEEKRTYLLCILDLIRTEVSRRISMINSRVASRTYKTRKVSSDMTTTLFYQTLVEVILPQLIAVVNNFTYPDDNDKLSSYIEEYENILGTFNINNTCVEKHESAKKLF